MRHEKGARAFGDRPFTLIYGGEDNLVSDTVESALMKFAPSRASRGSLRRSSPDSRGRLSRRAQSGCTDCVLGLRLSDGGLSQVAVDFFGPATSSLAYRFALWVSERAGPYGYRGAPNDPVSTYLGGNFTGGWLAPALFPLRVIASAPFIAVLPFSEVSPHSSYP